MIGLILILIVVGVALSFIPMDAGIRQIVIAVIAVVVLFTLIKYLAPGALNF